MRADVNLTAVLCMDVDAGTRNGRKCGTVNGGTRNAECSERGMEERGMEEMRKYMERFPAGKYRVDGFTYTGVKVARGENGDVVPSQTEYVRKLQETGRPSKKKAGRSRDLGRLGFDLGRRADRTRSSCGSFHGCAHSGAETVGEVIRANKVVRRLNAAGSRVYRGCAAKCTVRSGRGGQRV